MPEDKKSKVFKFCRIEADVVNRLYAYRSRHGYRSASIALNEVLDMVEAQENAQSTSTA